MKKNIILIMSIAAVTSTLFGCTLSKSPKNVQAVNQNIKNLNSSKINIETMNYGINNKSSNYFKINASDSENIKLYKQAYNTCYDLYKQGFVLRNYVLDVEEMCFEHGKNTVYEIIYNCVYKDMDIEVPLESLKNEQVKLNKELNFLNKNANVKEYTKKFNDCHDKGEYFYVQKALLSDMSCDEFMLNSYNEKLNSTMEDEKKILNKMKKQLENMIK